ncbi:XdhC family protein [Flavisericum labens]|uniref:XdhC family protein n=1 Tax=Flavisericum labens TaxID=3377112 RepID=UPI00387B783A
MTHEFKEIVLRALQAQKSKLKSVLVTVVGLDGSSYRRPGVRMLILENGEMIGAVSGGCVEKEILLQSESVFKTEEPKIMTYDGKYRLGCEGVLYILLELFHPDATFEKSFKDCLKSRHAFQIQSYFSKELGSVPEMGSIVKIDNNDFSIQGKQLSKPEHLNVFTQTMPPCFKLVILGAEHDAVQLCKYAALTGWEVTIVTGHNEAKTIENFHGANQFFSISPEEVSEIPVDEQTAVVIMSHNFAKDLRYLVALEESRPIYIGILGPTKRREDLLSQFIEYCPEIDSELLDIIHGPAGIDIGSETPQEIAVSIISEILAVARKRDTISLSKKKGKIHKS